MTVTTVLVDLDGVVRHFDPSHVARIETAYGLATGTLLAAAFEPQLLQSVTTGAISRRQWADAVGQSVGALQAALEWLAEPGVVDDSLMSIVDGLRARGVPVAVLTNGTDTIREEMVALELTDRFDAIFNSAEIGYTKPDRRAFEYVCEQLAVAPGAVFFTDDSSSKLAGAQELGMHARLYEGVESFQAHLAELGLA